MAAAVLDTYVRWPVSRKAILWSVVFLLIGLVYFFAGFRPRQETLGVLEKKSAELATKIQEKQAVANNLEKVKQAVKQMDQLLAQALEKLPSDEEIPILLKIVSDLGKESGLDPILFKPGNATPVPPTYFYAQIPLAMEEMGGFYELARFFDKVSRLPRIVTVEDITVTVKEHNPVTGPLLRAVFTATTFKYLPPEARPKPPDPKDKKAPGTQKGMK